MHLSDKLGGLYDGYYESNPALLQKRAIAARQTASHFATMLPDTPYESLLDVGAGEGSVLAQLSGNNVAKELHGVEISDSGVATILSRHIPNVASVQKFNGYKIAASSNAYKVGTAVHVLEHVEHERAFIEEICRVCELVYIEVPLELTARIDHAIKIGKAFGHINFYNISTFRNLLNTSGVEIINIKVFPNSREYETHLSGAFLGTAKYFLRSSLLNIAPVLASYAMTYLAGALIRRR